MNVVAQNSKAIGSGVGAALSLLISWLLSLAGVEVPVEVQGALTIIISALGAWVAPKNAA